MQKTKLILAAAGFSAMAFVTSCTSQQSLAGTGSTGSTGSANSGQTANADRVTDATPIQHVNPLGTAPSGSIQIQEAQTDPATTLKATE